MRSSFAHSGASGRFRTSSSTMPTNSEAIRRPHQVGFALEQQRARLDAVLLERGQHHRRDRRGRQAQGQHRDQRARRRGGGRRLRARDALDGALAELVLVLGEPLLRHVRQERRDLRAARRDRAEREADQRAAQPGFQVRRRSARPTATAGRPGWARAACGAGGRRPTAPRRSRTAPTATMTTSMPSARCSEPKVSRCCPVIWSRPTRPMRQADEQRGHAADPGGAEDGRHGDERQHHDREVVGRADVDGEVGDGRGQQRPAGSCRSCRPRSGRWRRRRAPARRALAWPSGCLRWRRPRRRSHPGCSAGSRWSSRRTCRRSRCPANMMNAPVGSSPYVTGSSSATAIAGPMPGRTPIAVPSSTPIAAQQQVDRRRARCRSRRAGSSGHPCHSTPISGPPGSGTPSRLSKTTKVTSDSTGRDQRVARRRRGCRARRPRPRTAARRRSGSRAADQDGVARGRPRTSSRTVRQSAGAVRSTSSPASASPRPPRSTSTASRTATTSSSRRRPRRHGLRADRAALGEVGVDGERVGRAPARRGRAAGRRRPARSGRAERSPSACDRPVLRRGRRCTVPAPSAPVPRACPRCPGTPELVARCRKASSQPLRFTASFHSGESCSPANSADQLVAFGRR